MKYKIKQLKPNKLDYLFDWWKLAQDKFSLDDYNTIYEGEIKDNNPYEVLEQLFTMFNINRPEDFHGHSLSVSDVVELDGTNYYCDSQGWVKVS